MKKILTAAICICILIMSVSVASAISVSQDDSGLKAICSANTTAAAFCTTEAVDFGLLSAGGTCTLTASGTAATSFTVSLYASIDGLTFDALDIATTGTVTNHIFVIANANNTFSWSGQKARWYKGYYASKVGGDPTSAITMKCVTGGN